MQVIRRLAIALVAGAALAAPAAAQTAVAGGQITLAGARRVMDAAQGYARGHAAPGGAIAIVDAGGAVVLLERLDGTFPSASRISVGKAQTAAAFRKPTKAFEDAINGGRTAMAALPDFYPLQGGVPLVIDGTVVGAIGVSGAASADQDQEIALAGAAALAARASSSYAPIDDTPEISWFDGDRVREAFAAGRSLLERPEFKVNPSRRDAPGEAEVHLRDTDIFYVLEGRATLVTGGRVIGSREAGDDELRGSALADGRSRELGAGDVVVIPRGVPHWFRAVSAPLVYYTVKVTGARS